MRLRVRLRRLRLRLCGGRKVILDFSLTIYDYLWVMR
jgi:hypothetical protein